ncbi:MAG: DUF4843 domain-containing protein [Candidatus Symbiothrix sp.]|jgi:hypothetical protein|nr:DUF4843 domain-containing protein [Candidatus Symbiothrix sp.]
MKKYIQFVLLSMTLFVCSCEYEGLPTYSGNDEIYFRYASEFYSFDVIDSVYIHFGYDVKIKEDSIRRIPVRVMGNLADYDRPVKFILVDTSSTAKESADIELLQESSFIPAGKRDGYIVVKLKNTPNLDGKVLKASLRLVENEYFKTNYTTTRHVLINDAGKIISTEYRVLFDNASGIPNLWAFYEASRFRPYLGIFTEKKFRLICELCSLDRPYFSYDPQVETASAAYNLKFPIQIFIMICRSLNIYLASYLETYGEPLLEDDGSVMELGPYAIYYE